MRRCTKNIFVSVEDYIHVSNSLLSCLSSLYIQKYLTCLASMTWSGVGGCYQMSGRNNKKYIEVLERERIKEVYLKAGIICANLIL